MTTSSLPRISIVTPSFNQARFLEECIDSVLGQGYPNLEYVVMDGGSTDGSVEIIRKHERHLAYWQTRPDGGHYAAVAEGFARTTGEIMAWLNADDKYCPLAFFKVAWIFEHLPAVEWITGRPLRWSVQGRAEDVWAEPMAFSRERVVLQREFRTPWIQQESTFWRRDLWKRAGGGPRGDLRLAGDLELWVRFFRLAPLQFVETLLGGNRRHDDQRGIRFLDEYLREAEAVLTEELARPGPARSFETPPPLVPEANGIGQLLRECGVPPLALAAEALTSDLLSALVRLTADRKLHLDANRRAEESLLESEADRSARLVEIERLGRQLTEAETDRAARLKDVERVSSQLMAAEADRSARLTEIEHLGGQLAEAETDRAARLQAMQRLETRLAEADADRQARLESVQRLEALSEGLTSQLHRIEAELAAAASERKRLEERVRTVESSIGWRATEAFGRLARFFTSMRS